MTDPRQSAIDEARKIMSDYCQEMALLDYIGDDGIERWKALIGPAITAALLRARAEGMREGAKAALGSIRNGRTLPAEIEQCVNARADELEAMAKEIER